jgi:hypothetical protein
VLPTEAPAIPAPSKKSRNVVVALILLLATLVCGVILGAAIDRLILFRQHRLLPRAGMRFATSHILQRLDRELDLRPDQKKKVQEILDRRRASIEGIWSGIQPRVRQQIEATNSEIDAVLTPAQRVRFRELRSHWENHARRPVGSH